ncbi:hypothetical protein [Arthrobacter roseus]|uniref:hypothetical protein n=1 Tax=Arthrobacter roseus TaxID=136274 RepID=UPI00196632AC|nr:hypothetical protein [Arthrobacter roseus]MBM7849737.1 vacuolar-type H+-ATPase subunit H [Arthrobacter roseus]
MTSDSNRTDGLHGQDAVPAGSVNDPYARDNPLVGEGQSAVPGGPLSDAYEADPVGASSASTSDRSSSDDGSTGSAAKHEAQEVGAQGKEAGKKVAGKAKDEAANVAGEAKDKAKNLVSELGDDIRGQAATQQQRVADGLRSISQELGSMANNSEEQGMATHVVQQAATRTEAAAGWLGDREPGSLLEDVKSFARKRPMAFLAIAAGAGMLAGRLSRGVAADTESMERKQHQDDGAHSDQHGSQSNVGGYDAGAPRDGTMPGAPIPPSAGGPVPPPAGSPVPAGGAIPPNGGPMPLAGGSVPPENGPVPPVDDPRREDYL